MLLLKQKISITADKTTTSRFCSLFFLDVREGFGQLSHKISEVKTHK